MLTDKFCPHKFMHRPDGRGEDHLKCMGEKCAAFVSAANTISRYFQGEVKEDENRQLKSKSIFSRETCHMVNTTALLEIHIEWNPDGTRIEEYCYTKETFEGCSPDDAEY